jgi:hypothetical protein
MTREQKRRLNRANELNRKQAEARDRGPAAYAAFWWDALRAVAHDEERAGNGAVWNEIASHIHDAYQKYAG